ncbi:MAG: YggS family pyridoxal phosphate-dependent enzyme [Gammaproteobacteria bacterium]|nr:YggS family pyridoxal phosphate-dependent enzyme [Gammaproteobacteria bacterium]
MSAAKITSTHAERLTQVRERIARACRDSGRDPDAVRLLAVSKGQPLEALRALAAAGQRRFGESYVQEAMVKIRALDCPDCEWHFIGPLQSNKAALVAENFDWVHSIDRVKIAMALSRHRTPDAPPLQVCLQVNISGETSKSGVEVADLPVLAEQVATLPGLRLRGLMTIPRPTDNNAAQRDAFRRLRVASEELRRLGHDLDTLSMGMSDDLEAAIAEGSTLVRVGTALFGPRQLAG